VAETSTIEIHREDPEEELGMRIVGGKDTPLGNIVVQEVLRDSVIAADGRIAPGDHILEVCNPPVSLLALTKGKNRQSCLEKLGNLYREVFVCLFVLKH